VLDSVGILTNQLLTMWAGFVALIPSFVIALIILAITWGLSNSTQSISGRVLQNTRVGANLRGLIETAINMSIWFLGIMLALTVLLPGLTPSSLVAGLGVTTVAVGFAFKDIFENFLAGVIIMLRNKMRIGDTISCNGIQGKIEHISLRETHIRRSGDELVIVPNSMLFKNPVEVFTNRQFRRHQLVVAVDVDTRLDPLSAKLIDLIRTIDGVAENKDVKVLATEVADGAITLTLTWWTPARGADNPEIRDGIIRAIQPHLAKAQPQSADEKAISEPRKLKGVAA
jgi:small conductance mechanosensitive channel